MSLADARREERERRRQCQSLVLTRLDYDRARTLQWLRDSLTRAWPGTGVGLLTVLRELKDAEMARETPEGWFRARPRIESWVQGLPPELRAELSVHDVAALRQMVGP